MNIVTTNSAFPQFRCLPLRGKSDSFRYEQMINGEWKASNHSDVTQAVGMLCKGFSQGGGKHAPN